MSNKSEKPKPDSKRNPKRNARKHKLRTQPTLFVWDGSIRHYPDGSMLELHSAVTSDEWALIVEQTVAYKVFIECLRDVAYPTLREEWTHVDELFRKQLDIAVSRMRNIDPLLVARHDQTLLTAAMSDKMRKNAGEVNLLVEQVREQRRAMLDQKYGGSLPTSGA